MKVTQHGTQRRILPVLLFLALLVGGLVAANAAFAGAPTAVQVSSAKPNAPNSTPTAGTVAPGQPANWSGTTAGSSQDPSTCVYGVNCDMYNLTVNRPVAKILTKSYNVQITSVRGLVQGVEALDGHMYTFSHSMIYWAKLSWANQSRATTGTEGRR